MAGLSMEEVADAVALYEAGMSLRALAARFDRDVMTLRAILLSQGVRMHASGVYPRTRRSSGER